MFVVGSGNLDACLSFGYALHLAFFIDSGFIGSKAFPNQPGVSGVGRSSLPSEGQSRGYKHFEVFISEIDISDVNNFVYYLHINGRSDRIAHSRLGRNYRTTGLHCRDASFGIYGSHIGYSRFPYHLFVESLIRAYGIFYQSVSAYQQRQFGGYFKVDFLNEHSLF